MLRDPLLLVRAAGKQRLMQLSQFRSRNLDAFAVVGDEAVDLAFDVGGLGVDAPGDALGFEFGEQT